MSAAALVAQVLVALVGGPLLVGWMRLVRARLEGRQGASPLQPWRELRKLWAKQRVRPEESSAVFAAGPPLLAASAGAMVLTAPLVALSLPLARQGDFYALVFVMLLGTVALALAALDTGTAFGGMGASRAITVGTLAEPALLVAVLALTLGAGSSNMAALVRRGLEHPVALLGPSRLLALGAMAIVIVAESGRLPVDNPATHLELTMINEALTLEYAGADLALVIWAESARLLVLMGLFVNLALPWGVASGLGAVALAVGLVALVAKLALAATLLSLIEVATAKLRLFRVPELLAGAFALAAVGAITAVALR